MILETGQIYERAALTFIGWTEGDGSEPLGYSVKYYFDSQGRYLGPDICGIEPIFEDAP